MIRYKVLDILDKETGEPKRNDFYHYYVGEFCSLSLPINKCLGKRLIIHRLTGGLDGPVAISTSNVVAILPNECGSIWSIVTENTEYVLQEYIGERKYA